MTFLAIIALVISGWSLRVAVKQQNTPPAIVRLPYQVDALVQPHIVKPVYQTYSLPLGATKSDRRPTCPLIAPTPSPQPAMATLLTLAS